MPARVANPSDFDRAREMAPRRNDRSPDVIVDRNQQDGPKLSKANARLEELLGKPHVLIGMDGPGLHQDVPFRNSPRARKRGHFDVFRSLDLRVVAAGEQKPSDVTLMV